MYRCGRGGGVGEHLKKELVLVDRVLNPDTYLSPTCTLHAVQLTLSNPTKNLMGDGGLGQQNVLQLLHSLFNLQSGGGGSFEISEFKMMWLELFGEKFKKITEPVLTRWWTIGQAIKQVLPNLHKWRIIAKKCVDAYSTKASPNLCGSAIEPLITEPAIIAHLHWIHAYHEAWWTKQFVWLSAVDETSGEPGFRTHHMAARTLIMKRTLNDLSNNWERSSFFSNYIRSKENVTEELDKKCLKVLEKEYFAIAKTSLHKHFKQWLTTPLLSAMIGSDRITSVLFARWLRDAPPTAANAIRTGEQFLDSYVYIVLRVPDARRGFVIHMPRLIVA